MSELDWLLAPVCALVLASITLVPLGREVLHRGVVFVDLALAQGAACGALLSAVWWDHPAWWKVQASASLAALLLAGLVAWVVQRWPAQREALIGLLYVAGANLALWGASWEPHGRERLHQLLSADVLWAPWSAIVWFSLCAVPAWLLALRWRHTLANNAVFYPLFAVVLSAAVPLLGLYLVFALLIAPALWTFKGHNMVAAISLAVGACLLGLTVSWTWDAPSGACVALATALVGLGSLWKRS
jgi:zinc/manganese transport system permease protein